MVSRRFKPVCTPNNDLSFPPPFQDQAKYLALADQFLAEKPKKNLKTALPLPVGKAKPAKPKRAA
jgi:hypothetical protein